MTSVTTRHRVTTASALGLLLIASPGYPQTVAATTKEFTRTAQVQAPTSARARAAPEDTAIRPFRFRVPEAALVELRRRIGATQWPEKETVADHSQGVPLAMMRELARYWATDYDWRKVEAKLNALPQFITEIDGLDIHFIHVRSKHAERVAAHRHARLARLDHRAAEDHRSAHQSHRIWRQRSGRLPRGDSVDAGLRVLRQADEHRLGPRAHGPRLGRADEAPRLHPLRRPGRRLGRVCRRPDGLAGAGRDCSPSTPTCLPPFRPTSTRRSWPAARRPPVFRPRNSAPTSSW